MPPRIISRDVDVEHVALAIGLVAAGWRVFEGEKAWYEWRSKSCKRPAKAAEAEVAATIVARMTQLT